MLDPSSPAYNLCFYAWFEGELDASRLEKAINLTVAHFASLRTRFHLVDSEVFQYIAPAVDHVLEKFDVNQGTTSL